MNEQQFRAKSCTGRKSNTAWGRNELVEICTKLGLERCAVGTKDEICIYEKDFVYGI